jgi:hypothetical protein
MLDCKTLDNADKEESLWKGDSDPEFSNYCKYPDEAIFLGPKMTLILPSDLTIPKSIRKLSKLDYIVANQSAKTLRHYWLLSDICRNFEYSTSIMQRAWYIWNHIHNAIETCRGCAAMGFAVIEACWEQNRRDVRIEVEDYMNGTGHKLTDWLINQIRKSYGRKYTAEDEYRIKTNTILDQINLTVDMKLKLLNQTLTQIKMIPGIITSGISPRVIVATCLLSAMRENSIRINRVDLGKICHVSEQSIRFFQVKANIQIPYPKKKSARRLT